MGGITTFHVDLGTGPRQTIYETYQPRFGNGQVPTGHYPVGTCGKTSDGRTFFYARGGNTGGVLAANVLYSKNDNAGNHLICACAASAAPAGVNFITGITIGATDMTANMYAHGYLAVTDGAGAGQIFKISSHSAYTGGASTVRVNLYDTVQTALDATSKVGFFKNRFDTPILAGTTSDDLVGVPLVAVPQETAATATVIGIASFAWFQTWGPCNVLYDGTVVGAIADGKTAVISPNVQGAAILDATAGGAAQVQIVGTWMTATADTKYGVCDLRICAG